jgi:putative ABC transport system permease protein
LDQVGVNGAVLLFAVGLGVVSGLVFGVAPAWSVLRGKLPLNMQGARWGKGARRSLVPFTVVSAEVGLTILLLVSAGLLVRSLANLLAVDPGFVTRGLAQISVELPDGRYDGSDLRLSAIEEMAAELFAIPAVTAVSGTTSLPFLGFPSHISFGIEGAPEPEGGGRHTSPQLVLPGYLETMGIPILAGRTITADDRAELASVALISESMARAFWPGESPLGARILFGDTLTVVGIVGDVRHESLDAEYVPTMYVPFALEPRAGVTFIVRSELEPSALLLQLRRAIWAVDADAPVTHVSSLQSLIGGSARNERFRAVLMVVFGLCATVLAGAGVFGVTARSVAFRQREMGIRLAMGAQAHEVVKLTLGRTLTAAAVGIGLGLTGALWVSRLFAGFLFGLESWDPATYVAAAAALLCLSLLASYLPAGRAARIDPVRVLKEE